MATGYFPYVDLEWFESLLYPQGSSFLRRLGHTESVWKTPLDDEDDGDDDDDGDGDDGDDGGDGADGMWQFDPSPNPDPRNSASGTDGSAQERVMDSRLELVAQKLKSLYATGHPYDDNSPDTPRSGDSAGATNGWSKGLCFKHRKLQLWKSHPEKSVPQTSMATQSWPHGSKKRPPAGPVGVSVASRVGFLGFAGARYEENPAET